MAMIDWVDRRLHNWARWSERGGVIGLGYASVNLERLGGCGGSTAGPVIPTNACEAAETHELVMRLPSELRATLQVYYHETQNRARISIKLCCAVATVDARLGRAHMLIARAIEDKEQAAQAQREQLAGLAQSARP